jgi:aspartyl-tRNA(Asn)/glutamyl-tRNA(Gln) amidotransferase subunit A
VSRILRGKEMTAADFVDLVAARESWIDAVEARVRWFDAMLLPTVPAIAPTIAEVVASDEAYFRANGRMLRNPTLVNFLDGCALSLPCHAPGAAPVGLMVAGTGGADRRVLAIGLAAEDALATR